MRPNLDPAATPQGCASVVLRYLLPIDATSLLLVGLGDAFSSCRASPPVQKSSGRVYRRDLSAEARVRVLKCVSKC